MKKIAIALIQFYKICISPMLGQNCRFYPTCSSYTIQAIEKKGLLKGLFMGMKRILKCHPFHRGGVDEP